MAISSPARRRPNLPLIILGAVMAVLGFVSVILIGQGAGRAATGGGAGTTTVVVAARDLAGRTVLAKSDLTTAQLSSVPGSLSKVDDAVGKVVDIEIKSGQPVLTNMLSKNGEITPSTTGALPLPKGFVAFTLPTAEQQGVAGYIQAGDYIDIVAVVPRSTGGYGVRTIYNSVHVIRLGAAPVQQAGGTSQPLQQGGLASSLTIAVSECQAEYLTWFVANAQIRYTLLSPQDYVTDATPDTACPAAGTSKGVTDADVRSRWPGLI